MSTLILSGILEEGALALHVPFTAQVAPRARSQATGDDVVEVSLLDGSGASLHETRIDATPLCATPEGPAAPSPVRRLVSGAVAMPAGTTGLRLRWRGDVIHEAHAPAGAPTVRITWVPPPGGLLSGAQLVTWEASHPDDAVMHFLVVLETLEGKGHAVASLRAGPGELDAACRVALDADDFPAGTVALRVIASDGFHQVTARSSGFTMARAVAPTP